MSNRAPSVLLFALTLALTLTMASVQCALAADEDFESFSGAGFAPVPSAGQLDSDEWRVTGLSDGDLAFGDTGTSGDFARGQSSGGTGTGGLYAFDTGGNIALGVQPGGSDFTPGTLEYRWNNTGGDVVTALDVSYDIWHFNDQGRSSSLTFAHAADCTTFSSMPSLDFTTAEAADPVPAWASAARSTTVLGLNIAPGGTLCLRWSGDDVGGTGSRDEYGIDNLSIAPAAPTLVELTSFAVDGDGELVRVAWATALEVDSAGFNVYRSPAGANEYVKINAQLLATKAEPGGGAAYHLYDNPGQGAFDYLLEDVDTGGRTTRHGPVHVGNASGQREEPRQTLIPFVVTDR